LTPQIGYNKKYKGVKEMDKRKKYDQGFKEEAVKLADETSIIQAARDLGVSHYTLRNWVNNKKYRPDNPYIGSGHKYVSAQDAEKAKLLKENRELKRANEILKEALGFFAASQKK
jgi:transposase